MKNSSGMPNLSQSQIETLMRMASQKLGVSPDKLMAQLQSGDLPKGMNMGMVRDVLSDPQKLEALLNSDKAKKALQELMNRR